MGRTDPKKKTYSFSITYRSFFTMFPQMWINETKHKKGGKFWGLLASKYHQPKLTLFSKKFKCFFGR
jgi:hypothetical protein